jgi:uncharacterized membrane protein YgaE (UPF0421/DUF939 family)
MKWVREVVIAFIGSIPFQYLISGFFGLSVVERVLIIIIGICIIALVCLGYYFIKFREEVADKYNKLENKLHSIDKHLDIHNKFSKIAINILLSMSDSYSNYINDHKNIEKLIGDIMRTLQNAHGEITKTLFDSTRDSVKYNLSPPELHELLEKYKNGTITLEEAYRLKALLEEEKKKKEKSGETPEALYIGLILLALTLFIIMMSEKKKKS